MLIYRFIRKILKLILFLKYSNMLR
jgi:hypothetical protein